MQVHRSAGPFPYQRHITRDATEEAKLAVLRAAIDEGDANGIAEGNTFERVRASLKLPRKRR
jgi:hypothetical protein